MELPGLGSLPEVLQQRLQAALSQPRLVAPRTRHRHSDGTPRFTNRLLLSPSPYLQQHAHNPVNWYPWDEEAWEEALRQNKPVFASFGYSTCHWCHVMEEESFDDLDVAEFLNRHFIAIKVDRELRPDLDAYYMQAVQAMTGQGGWPLNVWLLPDRRPFFGGTYFPPEPRYGRSSFIEVLRAIQQNWQQRSEALVDYAQRLHHALQQSLTRRADEAPLHNAPINEVVAFFREYLDSEWGGIGQGNKFPSNTPLRLLIRHLHRHPDAALKQRVLATLDRMAQGGLFDQLGGGFHRYATDPQWLVPHFEKMLYDNAQLAGAYLEAFQWTGNDFYRAIVTQTLDYVRRDMTAPNGLFYSATDADSRNPHGEMEEGYYFTWTPTEIAQVLDAEDMRWACDWYGVTAPGHLDGRSVLHCWQNLHDFAARRQESIATARARQERIRAKLFAARQSRPAPLRDDKILTAWNGLMIASFAEAGWVLQRDDYLDSARRAATQLLQQRLPDGRLPRVIACELRQGPTFLSDYAFLIHGLLALYQADDQAHWLGAARALQAEQDALYRDEQNGLYYRVSAEVRDGLVREQPCEDHVMPSGNSMTAGNLLLLARLTGEAHYHDQALQLLGVLLGRSNQQPLAITDALLALQSALDPGRDVVLILAEDDVVNARAMQDVLRAHYDPSLTRTLVQARDTAARAAVTRLCDGRTALGGKSTAYLCERQTCLPPITDVDNLAASLRAPLAPMR